MTVISTQESDNSIYQLSDEQLNIVEEGQLQFKNGEFLTEEQADKEIEKWLGKSE